MVHLYVKYRKHSFAPGAKGKIVHLIFLMHLADDPSETRSCFYTIEDGEYTVKRV